MAIPTSGCRMSPLLTLLLLHTSAGAAALNYWPITTDPVPQGVSTAGLPMMILSE